MHHSKFHSCASFGTPFLQCSSALFLSSSTKLLLHPCCAFCGLAICAASPSSTLLNFLPSSCTFPFAGHASSFYWCTFCSLVACATLSLSFHNGHSLHLCPSSPHLKHLTTTVSCLLIVLSLTLHCITLLDNTSNLFREITSLFSFSLLLLQLWARCPNFLQY